MKMVNKSTISPLRIAMVAACPFPCARGTPVRIYRMAEALAWRGHEVHVVTYPLGEALSEAPFTVHRTRPVRGYRQMSPGPTYRKLVYLDPLLAMTLRRCLKDHAIDLVHAHHYEGLLVANWARRRGDAVIYDAHTLLASELPFYRMGLPCWFMRRAGGMLDRRLPRRATHTIAVTDAIRDQLIHIGAVQADQVTVIPNGVEAHSFDVAPARCAELPPGASTVIFAGNLAEYQGIDHLLRSFAAVRRQRSDVRLLIVSQSSFEPFEALAQQLGIREAIVVQPCDFDGVPALLKSADVAVNPRVTCDGVPQKLLNYMAAGAPIVSFDGSAVLLEHERTGLRVPDEDTEAMAQAILRLLDDRALAQRLGLAARQHVRQAYSWEITAQRVEQVYRRVLDGGEKT